MRSSAPLVIREASPSDRPQISALLSAAHWRHFHLDWRDPLDLLAWSPNLLGYHGQRLVAYLAAPPDPQGAAWIRSFCVDASLPPLSVWRQLWAEAAAQCIALGATRVASLISGDWMRPLLEEAGFGETNSVVFFEWHGSTVPPLPSFPGRLRVLLPEDLPHIERVDSRAFSLLWQNGRESLAAALRQSIVATGAEVDGVLVGYQLTTASALGAHLARLAVDPVFQGRGLGAALVIDLLERLQQRGYDSITLNTQADNLRSQELYRRLGFRETGQRYAVFETLLTG